MIIFVGGISVSLVLVGLYIIFGETKYNDFHGVICFVSAFLSYHWVLDLQKIKEKEERELKERSED